MHSRWYNIAVVLLWLSTMSWLIGRKVLPSMLVGEPPNYSEILEAQKTEPPVGWHIWWKNRRLGWAVSETYPIAQGLSEIQSRVHFDQLPLQEITPDWIRTLLPSDQLQNWLEMDAHSKLTFDPMGRLSRFDSSIDIQPKEERSRQLMRRVDAPKQDLIRIQGVIDGPDLKLWFRVADTKPEEMTLPVPRKVIMNDTLSPQSRLPGLREGQHWTAETYGPLRPPTDPTEILQAKVESHTPVMWNNRAEQTWLVVFRSDPGASANQSATVRGKLWVRRDDGMVLRQEVVLFGATLAFSRLDDAEAAKLATMLEKDR